MYFSHSLILFCTYSLLCETQKIVTIILGKFLELAELYSHTHLKKKSKLSHALGTECLGLDDKQLCAL